MNEQIAVVVKNGLDSEKRKSKVEIMTDFIKLNDEIVVCVAVTVDDLQVLKLQTSDSMSAYFTSVVQHLKEVSNDQQNFIIKALDARKICFSKDSTCKFPYENELLKVRLEESKKRISFQEKEAKDLMKILNAIMISASCYFKTSKMKVPTVVLNRQTWYSFYLRFSNIKKAIPTNPTHFTPSPKHSYDPLFILKNNF